MYLDLEGRKTEKNLKEKSPYGFFHKGLISFWLRDKDLNLGPSGYEPDELPNCSIPLHALMYLRVERNLVK